MGILDRGRRGSAEADRTGAPPSGAATEPVTGIRAAHLGQGKTGATAARFVQRLLDVGIDGVGPFDSADRVAAAALSDAGGDVDKAIRIVRRTHRRLAAAGGFVTGIGGFYTMLVSLPANVLEFYLLGTRLTAVIARLRGYDIGQPEIRSAILLTLTGADSDDILKKAGLYAPGGQLAALAVDRLPPPALMVLNKAIGFQLLSKIRGGVFMRLGRGAPVLGGALGGGIDVYMLGRIAELAEREFPAVSPFPA